VVATRDHVRCVRNEAVLQRLLAALGVYCPVTLRAFVGSTMLHFQFQVCAPVTSCARCCFQVALANNVGRRKGCGRRESRSSDKVLVVLGEQGPSSQISTGSQDSSVSPNEGLGSS